MTLHPEIPLFLLCVDDISDPELWNPNVAADRSKYLLGTIIIPVWELLLPVMHDNPWGAKEEPAEPQD